MTPAHADYPGFSINHEVRCTADGTYQIRWTVLAETPTTNATRYRFVTVEVIPPDTSIDPIAASPEGVVPHSLGEPVIGSQTLPGTTTYADLHPGGCSGTTATTRRPASPAAFRSTAGAGSRPPIRRPPVTGQSTGGVVAGAGLLLGVGATLFVLARRRGIWFTV
ncbi:hypothetical protein [Micromonospora sp. NPDC005324]|uniref:hypothetical protein n=1 Tax=Micromonospora sp. NPDC005324 TaxID=3157033 RepID=UPI0033AA7E12